MYTYVAMYMCLHVQSLVHVAIHSYTSAHPCTCMYAYIRTIVYTCCYVASQPAIYALMFMHAYVHSCELITIHATMPCIPNSEYACLCITHVNTYRLIYIATFMYILGHSCIHMYTHICSCAPMHVCTYVIVMLTKDMDVHALCCNTL